MQQATLTTASISNTRAGVAIKAGAAVRKVVGVPTVRIETLKMPADGQCCGMPYATEFISSTGSSIHVWFPNGEEEAMIEPVVRALLYWKDVIIMTWSNGEPQGYRTYFKLEEREIRPPRQETKAETEIEFEAF